MKSGKTEGRTREAFRRSGEVCDGCGNRWHCDRLKHQTEGSAGMDSLFMIASRVSRIVFAVNPEHEDDACTLEPKLGARVWMDEDVGMAEMMCVVQEDDQETPFSLLMEMEAGFGMARLPEKECLEALRSQAVPLLYDKLREAVERVTEMGGIEPLKLPAMSGSQLARIVTME